MVDEISATAKNQRVRDSAANIASYLNKTSAIKVGNEDGSIASFSSENGKLIQLTTTAFNNLHVAEAKAGKNLFDSEIYIVSDVLQGTVKQIKDQIKDVRAKSGQTSLSLTFLELLTA